MTGFHAMYGDELNHDQTLTESFIETPESFDAVATETETIQPQDIETPISRAALGRELGITGQAVGKVLDSIAGVHPLDGFFVDRKLSRLAVERILGYRQLGRDRYAEKYGAIPPLPKPGAN